MTKTLIIHPADRSTDFLKPIYANVPNATILTSGTKEQVEEEILNHDRIMMMGHGSPWGLFSVGKFEGANGYVIDHDTVELLHNTENIFIWCNADKFVNKHQLEGLYSGMFISEVGEANYCGLPDTAQSIVDESNNTFAEILGQAINKPLYEAYQHTKYYYSELAKVNAVAEYNNNRLYLKEKAKYGKQLMIEFDWSES
jgi:hypothetical protein